MKTTRATKINQAFRTAIARKTLPRPTSLLLEKGLIQGKVLDYGCGKCHEINNSFFEAEGYDPHFRPDFPQHKYDTIICNYVLNVVEGIERTYVVENIRNLLRPGGNAYITVRRDISKDYFTKFSEQYVVRLPLPTLHKESGFETYIFNSHDLRI